MKLLILSMAATLLAQCTNAQSGHTEKLCTAADTAAEQKNDSVVCAQTDNAQKTNEPTIVYSEYDKKKVETLIKRFAGQKTTTSSLVINIARELRGIPYVGGTLEHNDKECLVVNLRQLDCTTYVENVLAIYQCIKNKRLTFDDFCSYLRQIRYIDGKVDYPARQHYFTEWIYENTKDGFVKEIQSPNPPFTAVQHLKIDFMSTHTQLYPMLKKNPEMTKPIAEMEKRISGNKYPYIPKSSIANNQLFRSTIHDGDIIAITTSKNGLDTSHIGIAIWHKDGLHMLNASQIHKKVVEEPMTLYQYMQKHPSQTGIRIVRIL